MPFEEYWLKEGKLIVKLDKYRKKKKRFFFLPNWSKNKQIHSLNIK